MEVHWSSMHTGNDPSPLILVSGSTGYVGGRLVPRLLECGYRVRCLARDPGRLAGREWAARVDTVGGDVLNPQSLTTALTGVSAAYYLIHSMAGGKDFHQRDLTAARNFGAAARQAGVKRLIYLGGLGDPETNLSHHLRSRQETGAALGEAGVPVTEFRAGVVVGSGSLSFELIRYLTERLPAMICPKWVFTRTQPISIRNVLDYLVAALETPESSGRVIEIGGAEVISYAQMMLGYAAERGLRRYMVPVPVLTPRLSSYWVHLVTPIPATIARPLIEGLGNEVVVRSDLAQQIFPQIQPMGYRQAVVLALQRLEAHQVATAWSDALVTSQGDIPPVILTTHEGMIMEKRQRLVDASPAAIFREFTSLGGKRGWLYANWIWKVRGLLDRLVGGVGLRRGRRDPQDVRVGDALDFWRVEAVEADHLLRLRAEMKVPGRAWLEFRVKERDKGGSLLTQTAYFDAKGLAGLAYWYVLYPLHTLIFSGMINRLGVAAEEASKPGFPAR